MREECRREGSGIEGEVPEAGHSRSRDRPHRKQRYESSISENKPSHLTSYGENLRNFRCTTAFWTKTKRSSHNACYIYTRSDLHYHEVKTPIINLQEQRHTVPVNNLSQVLKHNPLRDRQKSQHNNGMHNTQPMGQIRPRTCYIRPSQQVKKYKKLLNGINFM